MISKLTDASDREATVPSVVPKTILAIRREFIEGIRATLKEQCVYPIPLGHWTIKDSVLTTGTKGGTKVDILLLCVELLNENITVEYVFPVHNSFIDTFDIEQLTMNIANYIETKCPEKAEQPRRLF